MDTPEPTQPIQSTQPTQPTQPTQSAYAPEWERKTLEKLAFAALKEQTARRRWGVFFKLATLTYLVVVLAAVSGWAPKRSAGADVSHTAVVNLSGVIDSQGDASAEKVNAALKAAFEDKNTAGVILRINSPGGSPVQSGMIYDEIRRLKELHPKIPLHAVVEDICASGGYFVAAAADKIYVNQASIVGSIGVLMNGFGFTGAMEKLGVERRLLTAGENKGILDPFSPVNPRHNELMKTMLDEVHQQFITAVRNGRGDRLKETPELFSGLFWSGATSVNLGLADELGSVDFVARDVIKAEKLVDYSLRENFAERFAKRLGADAASGFGQGLGEQLGVSGIR
ncbi:peptidase [Betaproteobacteria bacterium]|nr:peptidase [Betaproteobacteria bacterium]GHU44582.1 peptidase [Betaproteobacteria bacterium]